ncbi:uncharacterized protein LOC111088680 isoform X2 [Limulus polyphemus]|uniref:Uncharacterized protein LOC111088680 isoform X2 n=1 Tax=Limulus polyphemus TaxID=6850 RepID=A0ABM1TGZ2_LIMPO|nr:uncharacterized protein LOC111088680 isoform X2 [Limulus polyphemus]
MGLNFSQKLGIPSFVWLQSVSVLGVPIQERNPVNGAYFVPARVSVLVKARISIVKGTIEVFSWNISGYPYPCVYNDLKGSSEGETFLSLSEEALIEYGMYFIHLMIWSNKDVCSSTNLTLYAFPLVALCQVYVEAYVAYDWAEDFVLACSIPSDRTPLTYQLYINLTEKLAPVTLPQFSYVFRFIGLPPINGRSSSFTAKVCDKFGVCQWFPSNPVQVTLPTNVTQSAKTLNDLTERAPKTGNLLQALNLVSLAASASSSSLSTEESQLMISYVTDIIANQPLTLGDAAVMIDSINPLLSSNDQMTRLKTIACIERIILKARAFEINPSVAVIQDAFIKIARAMVVFQDDLKNLQRSARALQRLTGVAASVLSIGQKLELNSQAINFPMAVLQHTLLNKESNIIIVKGKKGNESVEAMTDVNTVLENRFKQWTCASKTCEGIVLAVLLYPVLNPFLEDPYCRRLTPVITVELRTPGTGKLIQLNSVSNSVCIKLSQTVSESGEGLVPKCHFWDHNEKAWKMIGVETLGVTRGTVSCCSNHLTAFTVLEVPSVKPVVKVEIWSWWRRVSAYPLCRFSCLELVEKG